MWLLPVPGGPRKRASACWVTQRAVASSKTRARFIFLLKSKSKVSSRLAASRKARLLQVPFEEPILPADELVLDEAREEIDGGQLLGLRLEQADLQPGRDARAAELAQGALQFDDVHEVTSWIFRAMTSR